MIEQLQGHVDGVTGGELTGWAADAADPSRYVQVNLVVDGQPVMNFLARHHRQDVAEALGGSGLHGFAIDLSRLRPAGGEMEVVVTFSDWKPLPNCPLRVTVPARAAQPERPTVMFMHMLKTAGTAVRVAIRDNYQASESAFVYPDPPGIPQESFPEIPLCELELLRLVVGHYRFRLHEQMPQAVEQVTFVRHPLRRLTSHYYHLLKNGSRALYDGERLMALPELLEAGTAPDMDNHMVRCFCGIDDRFQPAGTIGREHLDLALHNARGAFEFIGFQEHLNDDLAVLFKRYGWQQRDPGPRNMGAYRWDYAREMPNMKALLHFDRWDLELYRALRDAR